MRPTSGGVQNRARGSAGGGKVGREGAPDHVGVAGRVHGDAAAAVVAVAAQIGGVNQRRACGIELCHERIRSGAQGSVKGRAGRGGTPCRKVGGPGAARHIDVAGPIHGDAVAIVDAVAAQIGGVDQCRASGVELCHERIRERIKGRVKGRAGRGGTRCRKVSGSGAARHIGVAGCVHGDAGAIVNATAPKVCGIAQGRIDDERPVRIVVPHVKRELISALDQELPFNLGRAPVLLLVHERLLEPHFADPGLDYRIALAVEIKPIRSGKGQGNGGGVGMRGEHKVVFESASRFMIDEVNAGVEASVSDAGIMRDMCLPFGGIVADEVMALARQLLQALYDRAGFGVHKPHTQHGSPTPALPLRGGGDGGGHPS